jgi:hypothetical protein
MIQKPLERLAYLCHTLPDLLTALDETLFSKKPSSEKWSKKEILGHLIDSATNNHQRFVRSQFEAVPTIVYDQNQWNTYNYYPHISKKQLIAFWTVYNQQLLELLQHMPNENLLKTCKTSDGNTHTVAFLFADYVEHMEHHLKQILTY